MQLFPTLTTHWCNGTNHIDKANGVERISSLWSIYLERINESISNFSSGTNLYNFPNGPLLFIRSIVRQRKAFTLIMRWNQKVYGTSRNVILQKLPLEDTVDFFLIKEFSYSCLDFIETYHYSISNYLRKLWLNMQRILNEN